MVFVFHYNTKCVAIDSFHTGDILYDIDADSCTFEIARGDENTLFTVSPPQPRFKPMITDHRCIEWTLHVYTCMSPRLYNRKQNALACCSYTGWLNSFCCCMCPVLLLRIVYVCPIAGCTPSSSENFVTWWKISLEKRYSVATSHAVGELNRVHACTSICLFIDVCLVLLYELPNQKRRTIWTWLHLHCMLLFPLQAMVALCVRASCSVNAPIARCS